MRKALPHHRLETLQARFADVDALEITNAAVRDARAIGYALEDVVEVVRSLGRGNFRKSETAHSPPNPRVWHDTYVVSFAGRTLYLKFAGETADDAVLTSFKEG